MSKVYVNCNYCGCNNFDIIFPEGKAQNHRIVKCKECGLIYANPQTTETIDGKVSLDEPDELESIKMEQQLKDFTPDKNQYLKKQYIQQTDYNKVLEYINNKEKGLLLDIGSYAGVFLDNARKRGWNVLGIEPLLLPRVYSEREFNLKIISSPFEFADITAESISVIVSFHVIEHIYNPRDFILKAKKVLKKGGLLVLETPTYDSALFRMLGKRERSIRCNGHIYFFTKASLKRMVEDCGFHVVKHETVGRTLSLDRLLYNIGIIIGHKNLFRKVSEKLDLHKCKIHINMRDMQRIYCEKT